MAGPADAIEENQLCWRDVCAGMTKPEVKARLKEHGFTIHDNWLLRWLRRLVPQIGGVFEFERYAEWISANRDAKCGWPPDPTKACSSIGLGFVRFPSGRRRLYSFHIVEVTPHKRLASEIIAELQSVLGPAFREEWRTYHPRWEQPGLHGTHWTGLWRPKEMYFPSDMFSATISSHEFTNIEAGALSPPTQKDTIHADSVDFNFSALDMVALEVERAWKGEKAGWIADQHTGCRVWNTFPNDSDTISWDGPCENGFASGFGVVRWSKNIGGEYEVNEGEFRGGRLNGHAIITAGSDLRFEGEFRNHLPNGKGTLEVSGKTYSGNWSNGCFSQGGKRTAFFTHRDRCEKF